MKKTIFLLAFLIMNTLSAQIWSYKSGGNAFDGKYKTATIQGKGTDSPYYKPLLVINLFNENSLNFYVTDAGYFSQSSDLQILWIFNNEPETIYTTDDYSISKDSKTVFLNSFKNTLTGDLLLKLEYFEKLKSAGKVDVRIKNDYGKNDIGFSLSGSTKAIDFVISKEFKNKVDNYNKEVAQSAKEELDKGVESTIKIFKLLRASTIPIEDDEVTSIYGKIFDDFNLYNLSINEIDSLSFDVNYYSANLSLYDDNGELIKKLTSIKRYMPNSIEKIKKIKLQKKKEFEDKEVKEIELSIQKISNLLNRYEFTDSEKNIVLDKIKSTSNFNNLSFKTRKEIDYNYLDNPYDLRNTDSINITKTINYNWGNIYLMKNDGEINFAIHLGEKVPVRILEKIAKERNEIISNKVLELIKKYGLTEEENNGILERALSLIRIYFDNEIELLDEINIKPPENKINIIILEFIKNDGTKKESKLNYLDRGLSRSILKRINKLQN